MSNSLSSDDLEYISTLAKNLTQHLVDKDSKVLKDSYYVKYNGNQDVLEVTSFWRVGENVLIKMVDNDIVRPNLKFRIDLNVPMTMISVGDWQDIGDMVFTELTRVRNLDSIKNLDYVESVEIYQPFTATVSAANRP